MMMQTIMTAFKKSRALNETQSQSCGMSLAVWDHTVLPQLNSSLLLAT